MFWKALWGLSAVSFVLACVAIKYGVAAFGIDAQHWFWNALILGVLATPIKLDCSACGVCASR